jgi:hypothetical protein
MLALAASDEVIVAVLTDCGAGIAVGDPLAPAAPAPEALLGATRTLERPAATTAMVAICRLTRGTLVRALRHRIRRGRFTGSGGFEALFELCAIRRELLIELIAERADEPATAARAGILGAVFGATILVGTLRLQIAAALNIVGVELALLAQRFGRASHRGGATRRRRRCRRAAREQQQSSQRGESHFYLPFGGTQRPVVSCGIEKARRDSGHDGFDFDAAGASMRAGASS